MKEIYFIGGGKMASAIAGGLVNSRTFAAAQLGAFDPSPVAAANFSRITGIAVDSDSPRPGISQAQAVLVAVKPQQIETALLPHRDILQDKIILSIAAGVTISRLTELTGSKRVIRIMPNTPALVGSGAAAFAASAEALAADAELTQKILSAVGIVMQVKESDLDAVTALSGSGPAYVFEFIQSLADGGVAEGLSRDTALKLAAQTVLGAAQMVLKTGEHPAVLKDQVTSPAGTTSRGLEALAAGGFAGNVMQAVRMAAKRSRELGGGKK